MTWDVASASSRASWPDRLRHIYFRDVRALLEEFGWTLARRRGSHVTFTKPGELPIVVSAHNARVTRTYLTLICNRLGLREDNE
jgi:predicted RNA binding protein YcfA (HicA-like mRNA interferase family)